MATAIIEMPDAVLLISMGYAPDPRRERSRNAKCALRNVKGSGIDFSLCVFEARELTQTEVYATALNIS